MASEDLELVRSLYAAWGRGDFSSADWADPDIEFEISGQGPHPGIWKGMAGMAEGFWTLMEAWEAVRVKVQEYRELDDGRVLVLVNLSGRAKTSGLDLSQIGTRGLNLFHIERGKVTRLVIYADGDRALADLGLAPRADASSS